MVFRYNESAGISSLDPAYSRNLENIWACNMLFDGLIRVDDSLRIQPAIARSWEIDSSGTSYTFHLRRHVRFHDHELFEGGQGRRVVAEDFVYSFERILDPSVSSPGVWVFAWLREEAPFEALNDSTLRIHLRQAFPPFLGLLGMPYCSVVPREAVAHYGDDFRSRAIGTGPFRLHFWIENARLVLMKNGHYFERDEEGRSLPYLDAVAVSFVPDKGSAYLDFLKGNYELVSGLHSSYKDELLNAQGELKDLYRDRFYLQKQPFLKTDYLGFLVNEGPGSSHSEKEGREREIWRNAELRRAVNYAIDRKTMVRYLRNNVYVAAEGGFIPHGMPAHQPSIGYSYQADSVRNILRRWRAKHPGEEIPALRLSTTSDYVDLCEFVQHQLGEFGIDLKVDVLPASVHRELSARGDLTFFRKSWLADYPDDENFMALFFSENESPKGPNYFFFGDENFDAWYKEALSITDPEARKNLYMKMDSLVMRESPVVPLYYDVVMRFAPHYVKGLDRNPMNVLDLRRVWLDNRSAESISQLP